MDDQLMVGLLDMGIILKYVTTCYPWLHVPFEA